MSITTSSLSRGMRHACSAARCEGGNSARTARPPASDPAAPAATAAATAASAAPPQPRQQPRRVAPAPSVVPRTKKEPEESRTLHRGADPHPHREAETVHLPHLLLRGGVRGGLTPHPRHGGADHQRVLRGRLLRQQAPQPPAPHLSDDHPAPPYRGALPIAVH